METIDPHNPPNEFPDIVGPHPTNPILARFRPFIPPGRAAARADAVAANLSARCSGMVFGASRFISSSKSD
jgi:hypothetical protein